MARVNVKYALIITVRLPSLTSSVNIASLPLWSGYLALLKENAFHRGRKRGSEAMDQENQGQMEHTENQPLVSGTDEMDVIDERVADFIYWPFVRRTDRMSLVSCHYCPLLAMSRLACDIFHK